MGVLRVAVATGKEASLGACGRLPPPHVLLDHSDPGDRRRCQSLQVWGPLLCDSFGGQKMNQAEMGIGKKSEQNWTERLEITET